MQFSYNGDPVDPPNPGWFLKKKNIYIGWTEDKIKSFIVYRVVHTIQELSTLLLREFQQYQSHKNQHCPVNMWKITFI